MPSFDRPADAALPPSAWVVRFSPLIRPGGRVLDLACGHGRHARHLLGRGFRVVAADLDCSGLADLAGEPALQLHEADLEAQAWPWPAGGFDGVVVTNYLHRAHFPRLREALAPRGVLLVETFGAGNELLGRPRNPDFLLRPGELLAAFGGALEVVAYEYGVEHSPRPAVRQRLCAVRDPGGPLPLEPPP